MSAFKKIQEIIEKRPICGHAVVNQKNVVSLAVANKEIKRMLS